MELLPYLRLNGVLMALEGGGDGIVCDLGHGVKMRLKRARNGRWWDGWVDKLEGHFGGNWKDKTLARAYCEGI